MPAKNTTKTPADKIQKAVKRYLEGEQVIALAKEYKVSRPGFYLWIKKYKEDMIEEAKHKNMSAPSLDKAEKVNLVVENNAMKGEIQRLKQKLFELMLSTDKL